MLIDHVVCTYPSISTWLSCMSWVESRGRKRLWAVGCDARVTLPSLSASMPVGVGWGWEGMCWDCVGCEDWEKWSRRRGSKGGSGCANIVLPGVTHSTVTNMRVQWEKCCRVRCGAVVRIPSNQDGAQQQLVQTTWVGFSYKHERPRYSVVRDDRQICKWMQVCVKVVGR